MKEGTRGNKLMPRGRRRTRIIGEEMEEKKGKEGIVIINEE